MSLKIKLLAAFCCFVAGISLGWTVSGWKNDALLLAQKRALEIEINRQTKLREEAEVKNEQQARKLREHAQTVTREVIRYVPSACAVDPEWVRIHNCAVRAEAATCPPDGTAGGPYTDRDTLHAVTTNYAICLGELHRLKALHEWIEAGF